MAFSKNGIFIFDILDCGRVPRISSKSKKPHSRGWQGKNFSFYCVHWKPRERKFRAGQGWGL